MEKGQKVGVTRGAYAGGTGTVDEAFGDAPGFFYVWVDVYQTSLATFKTRHKAVRVLLSAGQLEAK